MKRALTSTVVALAVLVPSASVATAHGVHARKADAAGSLALRKADLASCLSQHGVSVSASSISKSYLRTRIAEPGVRAALEACGHVPGA